MAKTSIEWAKDVWNPIIGCRKVSEGCEGCYAISIAWMRMHNPRMYEKFRGTVKKLLNGTLNWTGEINFPMDAFLIPILKRQPSIYFVNSMSDLFYEGVPDDCIEFIFEIMTQLAPWHIYQVLTKRPERMLQWASTHLGKGSLSSLKRFPKNVWVGVSTENQRTANERIPLLQKVPATVRFLSCEPLLEPIPDLPLANIDLVIVGGESGPKARPMQQEWVVDIMKQCRKARAKFFFKQWGGTRKKETGRLLFGRTWDELPL